MQKLKLRGALICTALIFAFAAGMNCAGTPTTKTVHESAQNLFEEAKLLMDEGRYEEGLRLLTFLRQLHPNDPAIEELWNNAPAEARERVTRPKMLGYNKAIRAPDDDPTWYHVVMYLPERIIDYFDSLSIGMGFGYGLGAGVHVTRAVQLDAMIGSYTNFGWFHKRQLGIKQYTEAGFTIGPVGPRALFGLKAGTSGIDNTSQGIVFHKPSDEMYQTFEDYWAIGGRALIVLYSVEAAIHPVELADFFLGWAKIDFLHDDFAGNRILRYSTDQKATMAKYVQVTGEMDEIARETYEKKYPSITTPLEN